MKEKDTQLQKQTALVLQGGGALGAYEAGTYQEIYKQASQENPQQRLFDIVAGTSIGAINSVVLVGHYLKNDNSWEGSDKKLLEFWQGLSSSTFADSFIAGNPAVSSFWNYLHAINPCIADAETARRFWSTFEFSFTPLGVPRMYRPVPEWGSKFFNPFTDLLPRWRYDYKRLREYLSEFVDFPIKTSLEEGQPRLLLTSVDVQDYSSAVVFDSYEKLHRPLQDDDANGLKEDGEMQDSNCKRFSEYGTIENPHVVFYDGIGPEHVLASALGKYSLNHPTIEDSITKSKRELWDGGYLSNTPLRELLAAHRNYWHEYHGLGSKNQGGTKKLIQIPELEVYIVNLHPSVARSIPTDKDLVDNRENDILFHDRTAFDEMVAYLRTDYVDLSWKLVELARSNGLTSEVNEILETEAKSIARTGGKLKFATYRDIIQGRTNISRVWRIDRRNSSDAIFGKTTDFTPSSIRKLIMDGKADARISLNRMKILFAIEQLVSEGNVSEKDGEQVVTRIRKMVTTEELYKKSNLEVIESYDRFVKTVERLVPVAEQREALIDHAKNILEFLTDEDSDTKRSNDYPQIGGLWGITL